MRNIIHCSLINKKFQLNICFSIHLLPPAAPLQPNTEWNRIIHRHHCEIPNILLNISIYHLPTIHSDFFCLFKQKHSSHLHISFKLINSQHVFRFVCDTYMSVYLHGTLVGLPQTLNRSPISLSLSVAHPQEALSAIPPPPLHHTFESSSIHIGHCIST